MRPAGLVAQLQQDKPALHRATYAHAHAYIIRFALQTLDELRSQHTNTIYYRLHITSNLHVTSNDPCASVVMSFLHFSLWPD